MKFIYFLPTNTPNPYLKSTNSETIKLKKIKGSNKKIEVLYEAPLLLEATLKFP